MQTSSSPHASPRRFCSRFTSLLALVAVAVGAAQLPTEAGPVSAAVDTARANAGLQPLAGSPGLDAIAAGHARNMAVRGALFHMTGISGAVGAVVPNWTRVGQNVGTGATIAEVEASLLASPIHRANILGDFTMLGSGVATGGDGRLWVSQIFVKATLAPPPVTEPPPPAVVPPPPAAEPPLGTVTPLSTDGGQPPAPRIVPAAASRSAPRARPVAPPVPPPSPPAVRVPPVPTRGIVAAASVRVRRWNRPPTRSAGYWLAAADGGVFAYGQAPFLHSLGGHALNAPVVALAPLRSGRGYWLASADGGVFAFGQARYFDSLAGRPLRAPVVDMAPTPFGSGYWLAAADGGVFNFGSASFHGSLADHRLDAPVVRIAPTPSGLGYWLVTADGGVHAFGDATPLGSLAGQALAAPIVSVHSTPTGKGYRLVSADGGVFAFGDAVYAGSMAGRSLNAPIIDVAPSASGRGYRLVASDGGVFAFGDASFAGGVAGSALNAWAPAG